MNYRKIQNQDDLVAAMTKTTSLRELINLKCLDCVCYEYSEIKECTCNNCPLYKVRIGSK